MFYNLLTATEKFRSASLGESAFYALLGFVIVFLGIAFLILVVWLVGKGMAKVNGVPQKKPAPKEKVEEAPPAQTATEEISEETIAVITAALMAYYEQTGAKCEFRVKRIKRI